MPSLPEADASLQRIQSVVAEATNGPASPVGNSAQQEQEEAYLVSGLNGTRGISLGGQACYTGAAMSVMAINPAAQEQ